MSERVAGLAWTGVFADIQDLKMLWEIVSTRSVARMLDKPAFRATLAAR